MDSTNIVLAAAETLSSYSTANKVEEFVEVWTQIGYRLAGWMDYMEFFVTVVVITILSVILFDLIIDLIKWRCGKHVKKGENGAETEKEI
jgi:hypothetical protein